MSHVQAAEYLKRRKMEKLEHMKSENDRPKGILKRSVDDAESKMSASAKVLESFDSRNDDGDNDLTIYEISEVEDASHSVVSSEVRDIKGQFEAMRQVIDSAQSSDTKGGDRAKLRGLLDLLQQHEDSGSLPTNGVESNVLILPPRPPLQLTHSTLV